MERRKVIALTAKRKKFTKKILPYIDQLVVGRPSRRPALNLPTEMMAKHLHDPIRSASD